MAKTGQTSGKPKGKVLRVILYVLLGTIVLCGVSSLALYRYGLHLKEPAMASVWQASYVEKTHTTGGTTINYVEGPDNGVPLLLIHGQMVQWESYQLVLPELAEHFHVFAVDCHGHGKSSHDPAKYNAGSIGADLAVFIEQVIGEPAIVSGNSSGGLLAVWLAANSPQNVLGVVLEDPPLFSSEYPRIKETAAWDTMETAHEFLMQTEEDEYLYYNFWHSDMMNLLGKSREGIYQWTQVYKRNNPGELIEIFFFPPSIRMGTRGLQRYDPNFGQAFYDGSWNKDFDHAEVLARVKCPAVLMHANWFIDQNGILMGAMSAEDADRAISLMSNASLERVDSGHATHIERPEHLIRILIAFAGQWQGSDPQ
jgi:pimeloyl-ACP methyl ester carboxylesterase